MKHLLHKTSLHSTNTGPFTGQCFVFFNAGQTPQSIEKDLQQTDNPDIFLQNPTVFSLRHLQIIEEKAIKNQLSTAQKQQFRTLAQYFIEVGTDLLSNPPHRMVGEIMKRPKLMSFLSPATKKKIEITVNNRVEQLKEINKEFEQKDKEISSTEVLRMANLYKHLEGYKHFSIQKDGKPHPVLAKTTEILLSHSTALLQKYKKTGSTDDFDSAQLMLCLEAKRLFPEHHWGHMANAKTWQAMTKTVAQRITPDASNPTSTNKPMRHPKLTMLWDLLDDIVQTDDPEYAPLQSPQIKQRIRDLAERGNGVPFLNWVQNQPNTSPQSLQALISLANKPPLTITEKDIWDESVEKLKNEIEDINTDIQTLQADILTYKDAYYDQIITDTNNEEVKLYHESKAIKETAFKDLLTQNINQPLSDLHTKLTVANPQQPELLGDLINVSTSIKALQNNLTQEDFTLQAELLANEVSRIYERSIYNKVIKKSIDQNEYDTYTEFTARHKTATTAADKTKSLSDAVYNSIEIPEDLNLKIKEKNEVIQGKRSLRQKIEKESIDRQQYIKNFIQGNATARKKITQTIQALSQRLIDGDLNHTDLQLILSLDDPAIASELSILTTEQKTILRNLRDTSKAIITQATQSTKNQPIEALLEALSPEKIDQQLKAKGVGFSSIFGENAENNKRDLVHGLIQFHLPHIAHLRDDEESMQIFDQIQTQNEATMHNQKEESTEGSPENPAETLGFLEEQKREFNTYLEHVHQHELSYFLSRYSSLSDYQQQTLIDQLALGNVSRSQVLKMLQNIPWQKNPPADWNPARMADKVMLESAFNGGKELLNGFHNASGLENQTITNAINATETEAETLRVLIQDSTQEWNKIHKNSTEGDNTPQKIQQFWNIMRPQLMAIIISMSDSCYQSSVFTDSDHKEIFTTLRDNLISHFESNLNALAKDPSQNNQSWQSIESLFPKVRDAFDFRNGKIGQEAKQQKEIFKDQNEGMQILEEGGFFEDETEKKDEFRQYFKSVQVQFNNDFSHYQEKSRSVLRLLRYDLKQFKDEPEAFELKYPNMSYEYALNIADQYEDQHGQLETHWKKFGTNPKDSSKFFDSWFEKYNTSAGKRAESLREMKTWQNIAEFAQTARQEVTQFDNYLSEYDKYRQSKPGFSFENKHLEKYVGKMGRGAKNTVLDFLALNPASTYQTFSFTDVVRIIQQIVETNDLRSRRRSDKAVANIGLSLFDENNAYGKEFKRMGEDSEGKRVQEYESQYGDAEGTMIMEQLYNTKDEDEARALINLASQKGFLKWDDPRLWRTLMKLQSEVTFFIPEDQNLNMDAIRDKVSRAATAIWSKDVFDTWQAGFDGNLSSAKGRFSLEFMTLSNSGELPGEISKMLQAWKAGDTDAVDPARFENFLFQAWDNGKMNGVPDVRWYFFIQGLTLENPHGQTILSRETIDRVNGTFLARLPMMEFLADRFTKKHNGRVVPDNCPFGETRLWTMDDYKIWADMMGTDNNQFDPGAAGVQSNINKFYYQIMVQSGVVASRMERMQRVLDKEGDHDDAAAFTPFASADKVKQAMSRDSSNKDKHTPDYHRNFMSGYHIYFEEMHRYIIDSNELYGEADWWKIEREKILGKVGESLRSGMEGVMIMQGSSAGIGKHPSIFSESDINNKDGFAKYAPFCDSRDQIFTMMESVVDAKEKDPEVRDEFIDLMKFKGNQHGTDWHIIAQKLTPNKVEKLRGITSESPEQGGRYYQDTDAIWSALTNIYG